MDDVVNTRLAGVEAGGLADELGLRPGDEIVSVNGKRPRDLIALSYDFAESDIVLRVRHRDGSLETFDFEKDIDEELGASFETATFDGVRRCANSCDFCFVAQMPPGMRRSLYIKDDDYRLSYLDGSYITLTNAGEGELRRICAYHLSPLYISVHTMNMGLRAAMLNNPRGADLARQLSRLERRGIDYHAQLVLLPGVNDGAELTETLARLWERRPHCLDVACVPVGLTRCQRHGNLRRFSAMQARETVARVRDFAAPWAQASDEFYLLAGLPLPPAPEYGDFPQLANGVGMSRLFVDNWLTDSGRWIMDDGAVSDGTWLAVCGTLIAPTLRALFKGSNLVVVPVVNERFGSSVTVSGLLTGADIAATCLPLTSGGQVSGVALSANTAPDGVLLDDMTLDELAARLGVSVRVKS